MKMKMKDEDEDKEKGVRVKMKRMTMTMRVRIFNTFCLLAFFFCLRKQKGSSSSYACNPAFPTGWPCNYS